MAALNKAFLVFDTVVGMVESCVSMAWARCIALLGGSQLPARLVQILYPLCLFLFAFVEETLLANYVGGTIAGLLQIE